MSSNSSLKQIFSQYPGEHKGMDGKSFVKVFKDNKILNKDFTTTDLDITFAKYKTKGEKIITVDQFESCLKESATKLKISLDELLSKISQTGPKYVGTEADNVRLHDDKSTYTGVYAKGGPTNVDNHNADLSHLTNRKEADNRGVLKSQPSLKEK